MRLRDHFRQQLCEDFAFTRQQFVFGVLADPDAMQQLDSHYDLWADVDLSKLGEALANIEEQKAKLTPSTPGFERSTINARLRELRGQVSKLIEEAWLERLINYCDAEFSEVDLKALLDEYNAPEPDDRTWSQVCMGTGPNHAARMLEADT